MSRDVSNLSRPVKRPMHRILIGGPVRETPGVVREYLDSLSRLDIAGFEADFAFVDDNDDPESSRVLEAFEPDGDVFVLPCRSERPTFRMRTRGTGFREELLERARAGGYDAALLVDGDVLLHPRTLQQLWADGVDVVAPVIGTEDLRRPDLFPVPAVSGCVLVAGGGFEGGAGQGMYVDTRFPAFSLRRGDQGLAAWRAMRVTRRDVVEALAAAQRTIRGYFSTHPLVPLATRRFDGFASPLREEIEAVADDRLADAQVTGRVCLADLVEADAEPIRDGRVHVHGVLVERGRLDPVGGSAHLFRLGRALDVDLVDVRGTWTIERLELGDLVAAPTVPAPRRSRENRVVLSMIVRNDGDRHLAQVLLGALELVDDVILVDVGSTDDTVAACERLLERFPHEIISVPGDTPATTLRELHWELAVVRRPDWVLTLEADEVFEDGAAEAFRALVDDPGNDAVAFLRDGVWTSRLVRVNGESPFPAGAPGAPVIQSRLRIRRLVDELPWDDQG